MGTKQIGKRLHVHDFNYNIFVSSPSHTLGLVFIEKLHSIYSFHIPSLMNPGLLVNLSILCKNP